MGWERWNLSQNPFDSRPLELSDELRELFVDREKERLELEKILASPGTRAVIEGDVGVGKTTLMNKILDETAGKRPDFLVVYPTVKLRPGMSGAEIELSVAAALAGAVKKLKEEASKKTRRKIDEILGETKELEAIGLSIGLPFPSAPSVGISVSYRRPPPLLGHKSFDLTYRISELLPELGYSTAVVAINSFDVIEESLFDEVLNHIRDFLFIRNISFVLLAGRGFYNRAQMRLPRWRGVLSARPVEAWPFSKKEINDILNERINFFSLRGKTGVDPVAPELRDFVVETGEGNIRWVLSTLSGLSTVFLESMKVSDVITLEIAKPVLVNWAQQKLQALTRGERKVIMKMVEYGTETYSADKKFMKLCKLTQPRLSQLFSRLERKGQIVKRYDELGRKVLYSPAPDYKVLSASAEKESG